MTINYQTKMKIENICYKIKKELKYVHKFNEQYQMLDLLIDELLLLISNWEIRYES